MATKREPRPKASPGRKALKGSRRSGGNSGRKAAVPQPEQRRGRGRPPGEVDPARQYALGRARNERAKARINELRLARLRGEVVSAEQVRADRAALIRAMVQLMERAGAELSAKLAGLPAGEVRRMVDAYFHNIRLELSKR